MAALAEFPHRDQVSVVWRSYQLAPDSPVGARRGELEAWVEQKGMPTEQVRQMFGDVARTAAAEGIEIDFDTVIAANSFDAHRLLQLAVDRRIAVSVEVDDDRDGWLTANGWTVVPPEAAAVRALKWARARSRTGT